MVATDLPLKYLDSNAIRCMHQNTAQSSTPPPYRRVWDFLRVHSFPPPCVHPSAHAGTGERAVPGTMCCEQVSNSSALKSRECALQKTTF